MSAEKETSKKETSKTISVPKEAPGAYSALSGVSMMAIDTDPEDNLRLFKENVALNGWTLLSVIQHEFHGRPPYGFIVVYYNPKADKGHAEHQPDAQHPEPLAPRSGAPAPSKAAAPAPPPQVSGAGISTALND